MPTSHALSETPPLHATFNPLIRPYLVAMVAWYLLLSIFGAPLILVWVLGPGQWWARHYFDRLGCTLDDRTLQFRKGILFRVEKTIPLENIQDVTFIEGPILRLYHLSILRVETAGQSPGQAHSMQLVGIVDAHAPGIALGTNVRHATFGMGTVTDIEGNGAHARVQVNFDEAGSKWLVLAYANLQIM